MNLVLDHVEQFIDDMRRHYFGVVIPMKKEQLDLEKEMEVRYPKKKQYIPEIDSIFRELENAKLDFLYYGEETIELEKDLFEYYEYFGWATCRRTVFLFKSGEISSKLSVLIRDDVIYEISSEDDIPAKFRFANSDDIDTFKYLEECISFQDAFSRNNKRKGS